jgi:steroid delta-isomerase-like uncharacterized protein
MNHIYSNSQTKLVSWLNRICFTTLTLASFIIIPTSASADDHVAGMKDYLAAWNEHDATKAANFLAEDVVYFDASVGKPINGRAEAKKNVIEAFMNAVPNLKWESVGEPVVSNNTVAFEWKFSGTNTGDWSDGTKASNKTFSINGMSIFRFNSNKIIYQGDYYDALSFYTQLGLM